MQETDKEIYEGKTENNYNNFLLKFSESRYVYSTEYFKKRYEAV